MTKIWIGYVSCGLGHKKAASALAEVFGKKERYVFNLLDFGFFKAFYEEGYRILVGRFPLLWRLIYKIYFLNFFKKTLLSIHLFIFKGFIKEIIKANPPILISTHFFLSQLVSYLKAKKEISTKLITVVTDYGVHPLWLNIFTDYYVVSTSQQKALLFKKSGVSQDRIKTWGIPLRREFLERQNLDLLEAKYKKPKDIFCILLFCSSFGLGPLKEIIERFYKRCGIFVIYGKRKKIKNLLVDILGKSLYLLGFEYKEEIWELMELSDVIVTKPGGLSVSEAIAKRKPLLFMHSFYGQEKENLKYVLKNNLGFYPGSKDKLINTIDSFIRDRSSLLKIKENLRKIEFPDSALRIKELVKTLLGNDS